jgi:chloramphenicol 3-O-phosphotransferase
MSARPSVERLLADLVAALGTEDLHAELTDDPVRAAEIVETLADVATAPDRRIESVVRNGRRVDATILQADRDWCIVCSIDRHGVHSASAFERPSEFHGVPGGRAVIVVGPSSAGKSTVMRAVVDAARTPWVMFDELSFGTVAWPFLIWSDRSPTLRAGFVAGIAALAAAGNQVILPGPQTRAHPSELDRLTDAVPTVVVALDCPLEVRIARQQERDDRWGGLTEGAKEGLDGWTVDARFDTSTTTPEAIANAILELVEDRLGDQTSASGS